MSFSTDHPSSPLRAVFCVRVSSPDQARRGAHPEGLSIPAQREANRRRALEISAQVVAEFLERGRPGTSIERPELQRMLRYIQEQPVDFVIVHKIDRLARNRTDDAAITKTILETGAHLVSTTEAISTTPSGRLLHGIMASIAEFCSRNLATEMTRGMRQKATQGGTPGRAPLGYLNQRHIEDGREICTVTVDPERGPHVAWAFRAYTTGEHRRDHLRAQCPRADDQARPEHTRPAADDPQRPPAPAQPVLRGRRDIQRRRIPRHPRTSRRRGDVGRRCRTSWSPDATASAPALTTTT